MQATPDQTAAETDSRRAVMRLCAEAPAVELDAALNAVLPGRPLDEVRRAETGLVMLRGRMGGDGAPFNFGEATVTRAAVSIAGGPIGFAYHLGRDRRKARAAAALDAAWQDAACRAAVEAALAPVRERLVAERSRAAARTAATRVEFFTLVRGEDA